MPEFHRNLLIFLKIKGNIELFLDKRSSYPYMREYSQQFLASSGDVIVSQKILQSRKFLKLLWAGKQFSLRSFCAQPRWKFRVNPSPGSFLSSTYVLLLLSWSYSVLNFTGSAKYPGMAWLPFQKPEFPTCCISYQMSMLVCFWNLDAHEIELMRHTNPWRSQLVFCSF